MKSFNQFKVDCFITEGAAEKLAAMSPEQIADYKKSNPGAASKVDELLKKAKTTKVPGSTFRNGTTPPSGGAPRPPAGAYKQSDAANAAKKLATARQSDTARNKQLGVKFGPGK